MQNHDSSFTKENENFEKPVSVPVLKKGKRQPLSARNSNVSETGSSQSKKSSSQKRKEILRCDETRNFVKKRTLNVELNKALKEAERILSN